MKSFLKIVAPFIMLMSVATFSTSTLAQEEAPLTICTGSSGGSYHTAGGYLKDALKRQGVLAEVITDTGGSIGNIGMASQGKCDMFFSQPDAVAVEKSNYPDLRLKSMGKYHDEYIIFLTNKKGLDELSDLESNPKKKIISVGDLYTSGSGATWRNLRKADSDYAPVRVSDEFDSANEALEALVDRSIHGILLVTGVNANSTLKAASDFYSDSLQISEVDDGDIADLKDMNGDSFLESTDVPCTKITKALTSCLFGKTDTYKMKAQLFLVKSDKIGKALSTKIRNASRIASQTARNQLN